MGVAGSRVDFALELLGLAGEGGGTAGFPLAPLAPLAAPAKRETVSTEPAGPRFRSGSIFTHLLQRLKFQYQGEKNAVIFPIRIYYR